MTGDPTGVRSWVPGEGGGVSEAQQLLVDAYSRVSESIPAVLDGLTPEQAAHRPGADANPIGWLVWHLTRVVDDHVLGGAAGRPQVIATDDHAARLGLDRPADDIGYGDSSELVARTRFSADGLVALADYHAAVMEQADDYLRSVTDLDRVVDERWDPPVTLAVRLVSACDDAMRHVGQAEYVRGLLGV